MSVFSARQPDQTANSGKAPMQLAMADWDYSWLLRQSGSAEAEFHLLPRRMKELADRGFNALRIDAWPHLVAPGKNGDTTAEFVIMPRSRHDAQRGSSDIERIRPADRLLRVAQAAKDNGIALWLTSWLLPDTTARRSQVRSPDDYVRIWSATLDWLHEHDALNAVVALDFAHQFPEKPSAYGAWQYLFNQAPQWTGRRWRIFNAEVVERINEYLIGISQQLRTLYPQLYQGLSLSSQCADKVKGLDVAELDFLDLHLVQPKRFPWARLPHLAAEFDQHQAFCHMHRLQAAATAGSYRINPDLRHLPDICRLSDKGVDAALDAGFRVINPSYHARPQSRLWDEVDWLRQINRRILAA